MASEAKRTRSAGIGVAQHAFPISDARQRRTRHPRAVSQRGMIEASTAVGNLLDKVFGGFDGESFEAAHRDEALAVIRAFELIGYPVQGEQRVKPA